jgi:hypothetical protein
MMMMTMMMMMMIVIASCNILRSDVSLGNLFDQDSVVC